jgi:F0F1-type ATP synthase alpha subunit
MATEETRLDRLEALAETMLLAIQQQQGQINQLRDGISEVVGMFATQSEQIAEMQTEVRGLQVENHRILDHLFGENAS